MADHDDKTTFTFLVTGVEQATPSGGGSARGGPPAPGFAEVRGRVRQSVRVGAARGEGGAVRVSATVGTDVVVLHIADGPSLVLHPETARELLRDQQARPLRGEGDTAASGELRVGAELRWGGGGAVERTRGSRGGATLGGVDIVELVSDAVTGKLADVTAQAIADHFDGQTTEGRFKVSRVLLPGAGSGAWEPLGPEERVRDGKPMLVLIHGTFSSTQGTFDKLWAQHPGIVGELIDHYDGHVSAFEHATVGKSPLENARALLDTLPDGATVHLLTHSRGGLVAEALQRVCSDQPLTPRDYKYFAGTSYQRQLGALEKAAAGRRIRVTRVVRVAATARGTRLASGRLDAFVSVFKWGLQAAGLQIAPRLVDFLGAVAKRRADPEKMPGLESQMPRSPLIRWLNANGAPVPGELRVVAGNLNGDSIASWVKSIVADAYFWTANDLVVDTRSMYGAGSRAERGIFLLDKGGKVSHFNYFSNERTARGIADALMHDEPKDFQHIGEKSQAGDSPTGVRGASRGESAADSLGGEQPTVVLVPGLFGSAIRRGKARLWPPRPLADGERVGEFATLGTGARTPDGLLPEQYDDLVKYLSQRHEVIPAPYDWCGGVDAAAEQLAAVLAAAIEARSADAAPLHILAHEMGGLVVRAVATRPRHRSVWQRFIRRPGGRVLMLGVPNAGCWTPMQVLSGDDTFGGLLAGLDEPMRDRVTRQALADCPGLLQLQAGLLNTHAELGLPERWETLADADLKQLTNASPWHAGPPDEMRDAFGWGVPTAEVLKSALELQRGLGDQANHGLGEWAHRFVQVVGVGHDTPVGFAVGPEGLVYEYAAPGDGRVSAASARLRGVRAWSTEASHPRLPRHASAFDAYAELLSSGETGRLPLLLEDDGAHRPAVAPARRRPAREGGLSPLSPGDAFALPHAPVADDGDATADGAERLRIRVVSGDLKFIREPLILGHYSSEVLSGAEKAVDRVIGGDMSRALRAGLYPGEVLSQQLFVNRQLAPDNQWQIPRPQAVIVVGLGQEGSLRAPMLADTVRQGVIAWAQRLASGDEAVPVYFELAATLIGSGGSGIDVGDSARFVAQGVREANRVLATIQGWPRVSSLRLIELYLDRATEAWRALRVLTQSEPRGYALEAEVKIGSGTIRRPLGSGYRGASYDFISAVSQRDENGDPVIVFTLDTKRARTEVRAQRLQPPLIQELVRRASNSNAVDEQIGHTLYHLLIPDELRAYLAGTTEMVLDVNEGTAGIPWELLDDRDPRLRESGVDEPREAKPWAIRTKLVRKLRTKQFRSHVADARSSVGALVIGEPRCEKKYGPLPGARAEANAVADLLHEWGRGIGFQVTRLIATDAPAPRAPDAVEVTNALFARPWRVLHVAGHGERPDSPEEEACKGTSRLRRPNPRGVVLSNGTFLGPNEIRALPTVPELVFANTCYLAARPTDDLLAGDALGLVDRPAFAAGVAQQLIEIGVRCVVAAGWAVEDRAAKAFAQAFYRVLVSGARFIDAVEQARLAARVLGGNTWAAYQCYGDPEWRLHGARGNGQVPETSSGDEYADVATPIGLVHALETLAVRAEHDPDYQKDTPDQLRRVSRRLRAGAWPQEWERRGDVAEAFGHAWKAAGDFAEAVVWYEQALRAEDGMATLRVPEQHASLRMRLASKEVSDARAALAATSAGKARAGKARAGKARAGKAAPPARLTASKVAPQRRVILDAIEQLEKLRPTMERESLIGAAQKRLALIARATGNGKEESARSEAMVKHYKEARRLGELARDHKLFYPAVNSVAAEIVSRAHDGKLGDDLAPRIAELRQMLVTRGRTDPDFWSVVGLAEIQWLEAVANRALAEREKDIRAEFVQHRRRWRAPALWSSIYDQADFVLSSEAVERHLLRASGARAARKRLLDTLRACAESPDLGARGGGRGTADAE